MDRATDIWVWPFRGEARYVLEPARVQEILRMLDREVELRGYGYPSIRRTSEDFKLFLFAVVWPEDSEPFSGGRVSNEIDFSVDVERGLMGSGQIERGWSLPPGLVDLLVASLTDVAPTRPPPATPTPPIVPPRAVFFDHPEGELRWDGPDDKVSSWDRRHCEAPMEIREAYGIPALIAIEDDVGFWFWRVITREEGWRWTGYYHDDWQIWQGDDGRTLYLVYDSEDRIAFAYRAVGCA